MYFYTFVLCLIAECEAEAEQWLDQVYEVEYRALLEPAIQKDWEYNTNVTDENAAAAVRTLLQHVAFGHPLHFH
jgi:hypothetical protein